MTSRDKSQLHLPSSVCDVCWRKDGYMGRKLLYCVDCKIAVHNVCYGYVAKESDSSNSEDEALNEQNIEFKCWACAAVGSVVKVREKDSTTNQHKEFTVDRRPTECALCSVDDGDKWFHAMHPLFDDHSDRGRQMVLKPSAGSKLGLAHKVGSHHGQKLPERLAWAHTLCALAMSDGAFVYGASKTGDWGDDDDSDRKIEDDGSVNSALQMSEDDPFDEEQTTHHFVWSNEKWYGINYPTVKQRKKQQHELKCYVCGSDDRWNTLRIPVQCKANDKDEYIELQDAHRYMRNEDCYEAMHVGCVQYGPIDKYGNYPTIRRCYFHPGSEHADAVVDCFCDKHAQDVVDNAPKIRATARKVFYPKTGKIPPRSVTRTTRRTEGGLSSNRGSAPLRGAAAAAIGVERGFSSKSGVSIPQGAAASSKVRKRLRNARPDDSDNETTRTKRSSSHRDTSSASKPAARAPEIAESDSAGRPAKKKRKKRVQGQKYTGDDQDQPDENKLSDSNPSETADAIRVFRKELRIKIKDDLRPRFQNLHSVGDRGEMAKKRKEYWRSQKGSLSDEDFNLIFARAKKRVLGDVFNRKPKEVDIDSFCEGLSDSQKNDIMFMVHSLDEVIRRMPTYNEAKHAALLETKSKEFHQDKFSHVPFDVFTLLWNRVKKIVEKSYDFEHDPGQEANESKHKAREQNPKEETQTKDESGTTKFRGDHGSQLPKAKTDEPSSVAQQTHQDEDTNDSNIPLPMDDDSQQPPTEPPSTDKKATVDGDEVSPRSKRKQICESKTQSEDDLEETFHQTLKRASAEIRKNRHLPLATILDNTRGTLFNEVKLRGKRFESFWGKIASKIEDDWKCVVSSGSTDWSFLVSGLTFDLDRNAEYLHSVDTCAKEADE